MTSSSQTLSRTLPTVSPGNLATVSPVERLVDTVTGVACQLRGHLPEMQLGEDRIWLYCPNCRRVSSGWQLDLPRPRLRQAGDPGRFSRYGWLMGQVVNDAASPAN